MVDEVLEEYWSPTPIYGWKFYADKRDGLHAMYGPDSGLLVPVDVRVEAECHGYPAKRACTWCMVHRHDFKAMAALQCSGPPLSDHTYKCETCGEVTKGGMPTCGFYAYKLDMPLYLWKGVIERYWYTRINSLVLVELDGTVVEHERGYKASHQRIVEVVPFGATFKWWQHLLIALGQIDSVTLRHHEVRGCIEGWRKEYYG